MSKKCFSLFVLLILALIVALSLLFYSLTNDNTPHTANIEVNLIEKPSTSKPFNKFKYHIPKFMLELYRNNRGDKGVDVVRSLIPKQAESYIDNQVFRHVSDSHLLIFQLPIADKDEKFIGAELKLLTIVDSSIKTSKFERILEIASFQSPDNIRIIQQIKISQTNNTWVSFNVTQPVEDALKTGKNLKIIITITSLMQKSDDSNLKLSLMPQIEDVEHDYPILILSYSSTDLNPVKARKKRNIEEEYEEETNNIWEEEFKSKGTLRTRLKRVRNTCRKRPLYVNFAEIEYDIWIVQPSGYEAYQCQGRCFYPVAEHLNPTKHAIVQALVHSVAPGLASRSCCVPTRLDSISILYVDSNGVLTYRYAYKDMVVTECGCR